MISRFFIDRPIFASVLSIVITLTGGIAAFSLPIAQYPPITPPSVQVSISYPGANAQVVTDTVAAPIEQQVNGVQDMLYMSSQMGNDGSYTLTVTFDVDVDLNTALVMVQNRVNLAIPQLPISVQRQGITVKKKTPDLLMIVNFVSPDDRYDDIYLSNFATIYIRDELLRLDGVSDITYLGQRDYSIRAWLDPQKLASRGMTATDVANAVRSQNIEAPAGQIGQSPMSARQSFQAPIDTLGRLSDPEQFGDIVVKVGSGQRPARTTGTPSRNGGLPNAGVVDPLTDPLIAAGSMGTRSRGGLTTADLGGGASLNSGGLSDRDLAPGFTASNGITFSTTPAIPSPNAAGGGGTTFGQTIVTSPLSLARSSRSSGRPGIQVPTVSSGVASVGSTSAAAMPSSPGTNQGAAPNTTSGAQASSAPSGGASAGGGASSSGGAASGGGATSGGGAGTGGAASSSGNATTNSASNSMTGSETSPNAATSNPSLPGGGTPTNVLSSLAINSSDPSSLVNTGEPAAGTPPPGIQPPSTSLVRLRDVARVELAALNYNMKCSFDGHPSVGLAIRQLPGTNALDVAGRVKAKMRELQSRFPEGVEYQIPYDTTPFIRESVAEVVRTLLEAVVLVGIVVLVFLQNWRAALIPLIAVPVAIVGTFAAMAALGFSLNNISLFGLVLAIGIVVDDAIVVVENVERWMEQGLDPREATRKAMDEVTGPVVAVALVLCAVFVPCAFISGITGQFFRQFAVTIAISTVFSAFNSLTLSPALAAILLRPKGAARDPLTWLLDTLLGWFFRLFNGAFGVMTSGYAWAVGRLLRLSVIVLLAYAGLAGLTAWAFERAPTGFIPDQDQGRIIVNVQLPDSASLERTEQTLAEIEKIARGTPGVAHTITISGLSFVLSANSSNFGSLFIILDPFEKRTTRDLKDTAIMARLRKAWARKVNDAQVVAFGAPPIPGLSVAGGFKVMVEDRGGLGVAALQEQSDNLIQTFRHQPGLVGVSTQFRSVAPQLYMDIDRTKVESLGVSLDEVNQALQIFLGSLYVNSFNDFGRYWQVTLQAEGVDRSAIEDINLIQVRNKSGQMVLLGSLVNVRDIGGPAFMTRYNLYNAVPITGNVAPSTSTGEAVRAIEGIANHDLPLSMKSEWTELMFMQVRAGNTAMYVFGLAVVCVFLALAALYESWSLPLAVILVVPLCLLCSLAGVLYTNNAVNIFVQIGLVVLVGLACKNAILIVEFARHMREEGHDRYEATKEASRLRLRPILMTSFAFILGVVPLVIAEGAGAEMRRSLGTAVFSGMLGVTLFGIFLTPVFFYVILGLGEGSLFSSAKSRWVVSAIAGGGAGLTLGFLLERAGVLRRPLALLAGAVVGLLAAVVVARLYRGTSRKRPQEQNPRAGLTAKADSSPSRPEDGPEKPGASDVRSSHHSSGDPS